MEYNTDKVELKLREYGRNVQKLVDHILTIEDKETRNRQAATLVGLMKQINPNIKEGAEYEQKVWDDLFIISNFELDVESPYPIPDKTILGRKPDIVKYNSNNIRYKHYGRNMELMVQKAIEAEDPEEKEAGIVHIGKLMKTFFNVWNKDNIDDDLIIQNIKELSKGKLTIDPEKVKELGLFEVQGIKKNIVDSTTSNKDHKNRNRKRRSNNQKRRRN